MATPKVSKANQAEQDRNSAVIQIPVRMTHAERMMLRSLAAQEDRTMQVVIMRALRAAYPELAEIAS